MSNVREGTRI